ncbi:MAG: hypothetical protein KatS3mg010_1419 [Acidimicrobiia bacterium]|nr:MAG: hypothetical protein KatS3mg010_1419 [Acidimicrobiia bacterium]
MADAFCDWLSRVWPGERVELVETHISRVAFVGDRVLKCKKPVAFPFVDLSTAEARRRDCEREVALNRRLAPDVYLGVVDVTDEQGRVVDHAVEMVRMPAPRRLAALARAGADPSECLHALADRVAALHRDATTGGAVDDAASADFVRWLWEQSVEQTERFEGHLVDAEAARCVARLARRYLEGRRPLFDARIAAGRARDGHGDLLAEDIFCLDDGPRVLDCLEFDDRLRYGDVLGDVAFLAMDLEHLGRPDLAALFLTRYRVVTRDDWPRSLEHLYVAYRAHVRMKIACLRGDARNAESLLELAHRHLEDGRVRLVLVGGAPATGKSTIARLLAAETGWTLLRSDVVRKELAGMPATERATTALDGGMYTRDARARIYDVMLARTRTLLQSGECVVLDASWSDPDWRARAAAVARETASDLVALHCVAPPELAAARASARSTEGRDPSDADARLAVALAERFAPWPEAITVDTTDGIEASMHTVEAAVLGDACGRHGP